MRLDWSPLAIREKQRDTLSALAHALREKGFQGLCPHQAGEPRSRVRLAVLTVLTYAFAVWAAMALVLSGMNAFDAPAWIASLAPILAAWVVIAAIGPPRWYVDRYQGDGAGRAWVPHPRVVVVIAALFVASLASATIEVAADGVQTAAATHGVPALVVALWLGGAAVGYLVTTLKRRTGLRHIGRSLTLGSSIALVILFVPLFSAELWGVANSMSAARAVALAGVTVIPLFCLLCWQLTRSIEDAFELRAEALGKRQHSARLQRDRLLKEYPAIKQHASDRSTQASLKESFEPRVAVSRARYVARRVRASFRVPLVMGLIPVVVGLWVLMSTYIYILAAITIDVDRVGAWLAARPSQPVTIDPLWEGSLFSLSVSLPGHPYPLVALLLGVVLAAIFLASTLTEDRYKTTLADTALHGRVEECLLIALPFVHLSTPHDSRAAAEEINGTQDCMEGDNSFATTDDEDAEFEGVGVGKSLWYRWTAPNTEQVAFSVDTTEFRPVVAAFGQIGPASTDDTGAMVSKDGWVRFPAVEGESYDIAVDGHRDSVGSGSGRFTLRWAPAPPPENDAFATARELVGRTGEEHGDNTLASKAEDEPDHAGNRGGKSLWYEWTAPRSEVITFDTAGSSFDTLLAVYTGEDPRNMSLVAANDDDIGLTSRVRFEARKGVEYHIVVDGYANADGEVASGRFALVWSPVPANDSFDGAQVIEDREGELEGNNRFASRETGEPIHAGTPGGRSLWYRWTAPRSEGMEFDTKGSDFDTLLAVYTGSSLSDLRQVAANDDAFRTKEGSRVRFQAHRGTTYHVAVDGFLGAHGSFFLRWSPASQVKGLGHHVLGRFGRSQTVSH